MNSFLDVVCIWQYAAGIWFIFYHSLSLLINTTANILFLNDFFLNKYYTKLQQSIFYILYKKKYEATFAM